MSSSSPCPPLPEAVGNEGKNQPNNVQWPDGARGRFSAALQGVLSRIDHRLLRKICEAAGQPPIQLALKNGAKVATTAVQSVAKVVIRGRKTMFHLILDPEVGFGDGYSSGHIAVEGDLVGMLACLYQSASTGSTQSWYSRFVSYCMEHAQRNSVRGARNNIRRHYDLSNEFFQLWLDPQLVYSCAYFPSGLTGLAEAQVSKMDYICRKLNLRAGERVVDVGSGWGALALHMAERYGVKVRGFSIAHEQIVWAQRRASQLGLSDRVEFVEDDYRNISEKYDVLVSVGMLEHVGAEHYREMGHVMDTVLDRNGRGLLQSIGRNRAQVFSNWTRKRIFPGAYAPTLGQMMELFEPHGFSILDVENLRTHYELTLEHWLARFEDARDRVSAMFGPEFARAWRLYLSGALAGFRVGALQLFQIVFARAGSQQIPSTRAHLYHGFPAVVPMRHPKEE